MLLWWASGRLNGRKSLPRQSSPHRYLAIGRVVRCVEDERLRRLLKAAMWGMLVIIWIYQAYIQGNNAICPYTSEILHISRETFF